MTAESFPATAPALDYDQARATMVDGQVRPNKVTDPRILEAMRALPREAFLPAGLAPLAYLDADLELGRGRVLMQPMNTARLLQLARPRAGERALVVGGGAGYLATILSRCGVGVCLLDDDEALLAQARRTAASGGGAAGGGAAGGSAAGGGAIRIFHGDLRDGLPGNAPYDLIVVEGAAAMIPPALAPQLAPGGRIIAVLAAADGLTRAVVAERTAAGLRAQPQFDCATALLPGLIARPAFRF